MISIRKYLDGSLDVVKSEIPDPCEEVSEPDAASASLNAYRSVVSDVASCCVDACPATGEAFESNLRQAVSGLTDRATADAVTASSLAVRKQLQDWGHNTARHYQQKASEVKGMLLAMAYAAESVGDRDRRCAQRFQAVMTQLRRIATLEDVTAMRGAIEKSAAELKSSIERMTEEGRATLDEMKSKVASFQAKLEQAEETAACDTLTRLRSRLFMESQLEQRVTAGAAFSVAILDINGFKHVNDTYGHGMGDELLKRFATELRSACRSSDVVGRWGGDEFIVLLDAGIAQADAQIQRVTKWVCGNYVVEGADGPVKLNIDASVGLAEYAAPEGVAELLSRADAAMYSNKRSRAGVAGAH